MKAIFLASVVFMAFHGSANATEPAGYLPTWYQAAGTVITQQGAAQKAKFQPLELRHFTSYAKCTNAVSALSGLANKNIGGALEPFGGQKIYQSAAAICHAVLPYQMAGWHMIGTAVMQQNGYESERHPLNVGPFVDENTCLGAITTQNTLPVGNTPYSENNAGYRVIAMCKFMQ